MALLGISGRQLAKLAGMGESGIRKAKAAGRIVDLSDGSYDPDDCLQRLAKNTDPARTRGRAPAHLGARTPPVRTEDDARAAIALIARVLRNEGAADAEIDFNSARTADTILKAYERDLKIAQRRKELVPLTSVKSHIEKSFIGIKQVIQRMPSRHVPEMAAALGCDPSLLDALMGKMIAAELNELSAPVVRA